MATELTKECTAGQAASSSDRNPYLFSSDSWLAWEVGHRLRWQNARVVACRKSRGYSVRFTLEGGAAWIGAAEGKDLNRFTSRPV